MAAESDVPVVPCHIIGAHAAFPSQARLPRPKKLRLLIGQPLSFSHLVNHPDSWREIAAMTEAAVRGLLEVELA